MFSKIHKLDEHQRGHLAFANCHKVVITTFDSIFHFASVPVPASPVLTVSEKSSSFNRRRSFSSPLTASAKSMSVSISVSISIDIHSARGVAGEFTGPPGARIAPTALDRETLFGRMRKEFFPGMMRRPYFSPKLCKVG